MTRPTRRPVDDALDRLEHFLQYGTPKSNPLEALATVRQELQRFQRLEALRVYYSTEEAEKAWVAMEAELGLAREGLRFISARRIALETFGLGNVADAADRALLADSPNGAGIHSADPTTVTPKMMQDAGRGATGSDPWTSYGITNKPEGGEA